MSHRARFSPWNFGVLAALLGCASPIASAQDTPPSPAPSPSTDAPEPPDAQERSDYTALEGDSQGFVLVPVPVEGSLTRRPTAPPPDCAGVDANLAQFSRQVSRCSDVTKRGSFECTVLRDYVLQVAQGRGPSVQPSLLQFWPLTVAAPSFTDGERVRREAAGELNVSLDQVALAETVELVATDIRPAVVIAPGGKSWASRLLGLFEPGDYEVSYFAKDLLRTKNQILACGLLAGDVSVQFLAQAEAQSNGTGGPFSAAQLEAVYVQLLDNAALLGDDGLLRGAVIGRALASLDLDADSTFADRVRFVGDALLDPLSGLPIAGLNDEDFENMTASRRQTASGEVPFTARVR